MNIAIIVQMYGPRLFEIRAEWKIRDDSIVNII